MKRIITFIGIICVCVSIRAQDNHDHDTDCSTVGYNHSLQRQYPALGNDQDFEKWIRTRIRSGEMLVAREVVTIPVVVHVIHKGEIIGNGTNIPAAQVQSQIDVLNEDFRKMMNSRGFNTHPDGVDSEIEFCLAVVDPEGNSLTEAGINRVRVSDLGDASDVCSGTQRWCQEFIEGTIKPKTFWDPLRYFNIWVVESIDNNNPTTITLGYARFPAQSGLNGIPSSFIPLASNDGIVVRTDRFGSVDKGNFPALFSGSFGRTTTHEVGHWLGLRHIWGDGPCGADDFCGDTPASDGDNSGCDVGHLSCGNVDMVENYMDYSDDGCMNIFTRCQRNRMRAVLANSPRRKELVFSPVCLQAQEAPTASFEFDNTTNCNGVVLFRNQSRNFPTSIIWDFGNGETSIEPDPIVQYTESGTYEVKLFVSNIFGMDSVIQSVSVDIRGAVNVDAGTDFGLCPEEAFQLEGKAEGENLSYQWEPNFFLDDPNSLTPTFTAPPFAIVQPYKYYLTVSSPDGCNIRDSVQIDISARPEVFAGPDREIAGGDSIRLSASGAEFYRWEPVFGMRDLESITPLPKVSPSTTTEYIVYGTNGLGCTETDDVIVTVDGIPLSLNNGFERNGTIHAAYPNPSDRSVTFSADLNLGGDLQLTLYELNGRQKRVIYEGRQNPGAFEWQWNRDQKLPAGVYLVVWQMGEERQVQRLMLY